MTNTFGTLVNKTCVACKGNEPPLAPEIINQLLKVLGEGWSLNAQSHLFKEYKLTNFMEAIKLANAIAAIAEKEGHHPNLLIAWGKCSVELWTHKIKGLTENDFILAAKIEKAYADTKSVSENY